MKNKISDQSNAWAIKCPYKAFTLIELLVVIAIIAIRGNDVASPVQSQRGNEESYAGKHATECLSIYADDHQGHDHLSHGSTESRRPDHRNSYPYIQWQLSLPHGQDKLTNGSPDDPSPGNTRGVLTMAAIILWNELRHLFPKFVFY